MSFCPAWNNQERENSMSKLTLKTEGDTHVVVTRRFAAPPEAVYRAHTDPKLIQKWLLGPLRMDEWQRRWIPHHWRIRGAAALQQDRTYRAHAPAGSHARQPH